MLVRSTYSLSKYVSNEANRIPFSFFCENRLTVTSNELAACKNNFRHVFQQRDDYILLKILCNTYDRVIRDYNFFELRNVRKFDVERFLENAKQ